MIPLLTELDILGFYFLQRCQLYGLWYFHRAPQSLPRPIRVYSCLSVIKK
jgi:hypothetical protein